MITTLPRHRPPKRASRGWNSLSDEERRRYAGIPRRIEYVGHESFSSPEVEADLFGPDGLEVGDPVYTLAPEVPEDVPERAKARTLLGHREQTVLFLKYNYAKYRLEELQDSQRRCFSAARARRMIEWHQRSLEIRSKLAHANLALVPAMAKRARVTNVEFGELISEGYLAVLRSIEKFDVSRGFRFSTYACRAVLKSFHRLATKTVRYRTHVCTEFDPSMEKSDFAEQRHERQRSDFVDALRQVLRENRAALSKVEQTVIAKRFAVWTRGQPRTLAEVGRTVGLTNEGVRQVQKKALGKIRAAFEEHFVA